MDLDGRGTFTDSSTSAIIYRIFSVGVWIVSMTVIVASYIGLLVLYKKGALHGSRGEGHGISLKLTTLPVIMPFVINIQVVPFFLYLFYGLGRTDAFPLYWALLILYLSYLLSDVSSLIYIPNPAPVRQLKNQGLLEGSSPFIFWLYIGAGCCMCKLLFEQVLITILASFTSLSTQFCL